jgi:hypothetical protein
VGLLSCKLQIDWLANHLGGFFYVFFWACLVLGLFPANRPGRIILTVLVLTCGVEFLQLWQPPFLESIRATRPGALVLGTTFHWRDFPGYFVGALFAFGVSRVVSKG